MRLHHDEAVMFALELSYDWTEEELLNGRNIQYNFRTGDDAVRISRLFRGMGWDIRTYHKTECGWVFKPNKQMNGDFVVNLCKLIVKNEFLPHKDRWHLIRDPSKPIKIT